MIIPSQCTKWRFFRSQIAAQILIDALKQLSSKESPGKGWMVQSVKESKSLSSTSLGVKVTKILLRVEEYLEQKRNIPLRPLAPTHHVM